MEKVSYSYSVLKPREKQSVDDIAKTICEKINTIFGVPVIGGQIRRVVVGLAKGFDESLRSKGLDNRYVGAIATRVWECLGQKLISPECRSGGNCMLEKGRECPF